MADDELRVAILGVGFIGEVHARSARLAGARIVGVAAGAAASSESARRRLGAERAEAAGALAVADDIDVVHIATPNHLHAPLAMAALSAGKHVILEKPVALDAESAALIAAAADDAGRVVAVPFVYRFHPMVRQARAIARSSSGPVRLVHGSYQQDWMSRPTDGSWRVTPELGGPSRAFADIGSHWADLAEFVTGQRIERLCATTKIVFPERSDGAGVASFESASAERAAIAVTTEDAAVVMFRTDGGAVGSVVVSQVSPGRKNRLWLEVDAAEHALVFDQEDNERLWVGGREQSTEMVRDPAALAPDAARLATLPAGHAQGYHDCFDLFVADAYAAIRTGEWPDGLPTIADGVRAARITDAVLASAHDEAWKEVPR